MSTTVHCDAPSLARDYGRLPSTARVSNHHHFVAPGHPRDVTAWRRKPRLKLRFALNSRILSRRRAFGALGCTPRPDALVGRRRLGVHTVNGRVSAIPTHYNDGRSKHGAHHTT